MDPEDWNEYFTIVARPSINAFAIIRRGEIVAFADAYPKIEAIYKALTFSEKIDELAARTTEEYR